MIILTGNPSIHLKQRFLDEGAAAYIVKGSPAASNEMLLANVTSILGNPQGEIRNGIALEDFLRDHLTEQSRLLFLDASMQLPPCKHCGHKSYVVSFAHKIQLPPNVEGKVVCASCNREMDPELI